MSCLNMLWWRNGEHRDIFAPSVEDGARWRQRGNEPECPRCGPVDRLQLITVVNETACVSRDATCRNVCFLSQCDGVIAAYVPCSELLIRRRWWIAGPYQVNGQTIPNTDRSVKDVYFETLKWRWRKEDPDVAWIARYNRDVSRICRFETPKELPGVLLEYLVDARKVGLKSVEEYKTSKLSYCERGRAGTP